MKVYLDDKRETPEGWVRCYWPQEVIDLLKTGNVTEISLDHDLGDKVSYAERTGYDVLVWIQEQVVCNKFVPPIMKVHSDNGPAIQSMNLIIKRINTIHMANEEGPIGF